MGRDARHEAVVGRPRAAARARRGDRVPHPREPAVPQPHRPLRAEPRLHRDGAALRDPRERRVRPDRHRHAADAERDRLPRGAGAHGRLLRRPAAALAHAAVPRRRQARRAACSTSRAGPSTRWPTASSAASSSRTSPSSSSTSSRCTTASSSAREAVEQLLHDRRTTFAVVTTLEAAPLHEAERFCDELLDARVPPRRARAQQDAARLPARPRRRDARPTAFVDDAGAIADAARRRSAIPALADPARTARVLRTIGESFRNFAVVAMREAELRAELARVPEVVVRVPTLRGRHRRRRGSRRDRRATSSRRRRRYDRGTIGDHVRELARTRTALAGARPASTSSGSSRRGGRSPTSPSPTCCCSRRSRARRATGSSCSRRCGRPPARRSTRRTSSARVVDEVERPLLTRCWRTGEIVEGDTAALGAKERVRVQCIPVRRDGRVDRGASRRRRRSTLGAPARASSSATTSRCSTASRR